MLATTDQFNQFQIQVFLTHLKQAPFMLVGVMLMSLVCAWLMMGHVEQRHILMWLAVCWTLPFVRMGFASYMKPLVESGNGFKLLQVGFATTALISGLTWGAFGILLFDSDRPITIFIIGVALAGITGGLVTSLSMFLPAFYLFTLTACLPFVYLLFSSGTPELVEAGILCCIFLAANLGYAHVLYRLQSESIYLRFQNLQLLEDLRSRKQDAEAASRTKSLFLAGISHDLKQPIRAIAMYTGFLRHSAAQGAELNVVAETAGKIDVAVESIHGQISRLLELARLESGAVALNTQWLDLGAVFAHAEGMFAGQAQAKGIRLQFAGLSLRRYQRVEADARMLESILENLISNAVKHTDHGVVYVGTRLRTSLPMGQRLCIEVRDSGVGIAAELVPLVFDAYRSFDDRKSSESHGLGLSIAMAQATYLGCDIAVASKPGCGSTFTLCGLRTSPV
jgi:signal transduction histidine kinase